MSILKRQIELVGSSLSEHRRMQVLPSATQAIDLSGEPG
jgi:hypothetical protein